MKTLKKSSAFLLLLLLIASSSLCISITHSQTHVRSTDQESFTSVVISQKGLDFVKDLLITQAISSMIPLRLPKIEKTVKIPVIGNVHLVASNITIYNINVLSSYVKPGDSGVVIVASGATCNLSMNWSYKYSTWVLVPIQISDQGSASVQVEGMEVGLTLGLENRKGTLKLSLEDCGCYVKDISIKLNGGASWLYQGMVDAFDEKIGSAVENAITKKLKEGILKLDSFLQALPKDVPVDDHASLNVTFVDNPVLSNSSIGFDINGLFTASENFLFPYHLKNLQPSVLCPDQSKMLGISLDEAVFNSASVLYYDAEFMQWIVDKLPDQSLLNTAGWRFIIPQLYKKYPKDDMNLNISLSSPPVIRISEHNIDAIVYADLIIDVLEADKVIPVVCISLVIHGSGSVKILGNKLGGSVKLNDFTMSLKWSQIGNLHMNIIQPIMWTAIQTVFLPYVNAHLGQGFPLPIIHGFTLKHGEIICSNSGITICSDVKYTPSRMVKSYAQIPVSRFAAL
ncbi:hypothetical protein LWI28_012378 [Acer negundo]|uniref:Uncharacterized protein n=1 Tax=Acer negundo TaxID=4023 RepID=A0AAD5IVI2_ACENE|nr:hypothetical protein LWI28_012378 [Acer negundo]